MNRPDRSPNVSTRSPATLTADVCVEEQATELKQGIIDMMEIIELERIILWFRLNSARSYNHNIYFKTTNFHFIFNSVIGTSYIVGGSR